MLGDGFILRHIGLTLRIENHVINFSWVYETRVASLAEQPVGLYRRIEDVREQEKKQKAKQQRFDPFEVQGDADLRVVQMDLLIVFDVDEKLGNRHPELRMYDLRSYFAQRDKHEFAIRHLGVRNAQGLFPYDKRII